MAMSTMLHEEKFPDHSKSNRKGKGEVNAFGEEIPRIPEFLPISPEKKSWTDKLKMASLGLGNTKEGVKEDWRDFKGDAKGLEKQAEQKLKEYEREVADDARELKQKLIKPMAIPAFGDLGKAANDLINKDFYHTAQATLDVKLKAPNGTNITVKGKQGFDGATTGSVEGKHSGVAKGVTVTQNWTTASLLDSKIELADLVAPGVKVDLQNLWNPSKTASAAQKITGSFKNPNVHARAFVNRAQSSGNIDAVVDLVAGSDGFLVGGEAGYDVQKAAITRYSLGLGYQANTYSAFINGIQNLSVISAAYYQKVGPDVEVGAKAGYDVNAAKASGLEVASKYKLDPNSFAKAKINDRGIAALAYSTKLNGGVTWGIGMSLDTNKLNEAGHKIGTSLTFES